MTRWRKRGIERTRRAATAIATGLGPISDVSQLCESAHVMAMSSVSESFLKEASTAPEKALYLALNQRVLACAALGR